VRQPRGWWAGRGRAAVAAAVLAGLLAGAGRADPLPRSAEAEIRARAAGALAVLGLAAIPSETARTLSFIGGSDSPFRSAQFGGGSTWRDGPLYLEGYLGWNAYDPVFVFSGGAEASTTLEAQWKSVAFTGGVGWDVPLDADVTFRPILTLTLGNITSDTAGPGEGLAEEILSFLDGGMTVGGLGAALMLEYSHSFSGGWKLDGTLRHSQLYLEPVGGDREVVGHAEAFTTALWGRVTVPTRLRLAGHPLRAVGEASIGHYGGDQAEVLDTTWLFQAGAGAEIGLEEAGLGPVRTGRIMLRYTRGDRLEGLSLGLSASF
jgi:hypothetical protein